MTIKQFFESKERLAINCKTEEQAIKLLKAFDREGYCWYGGISYNEVSNWGDYEELTCYDNECQYGTIDVSKYHGFKILEFEDIEL